MSLVVTRHWGSLSKLYRNIQIYHGFPPIIPIIHFAPLGESFIIEFDMTRDFLLYQGKMASFLATSTL